jgi:hypothetical protein
MVKTVDKIAALVEKRSELSIELTLDIWNISNNGLINDTIHHSHT